MLENRDPFLVRLIKGVVIGIAAILPGASGGVLAVSMGVYRPVLEAVTGVFRHFKTSVLFLIPLGIGGLAGLLGTSRAVEWLMTNCRVPVMWALIGMVLGGVPSLVGEANARGFKPRYLAGFAIGAAVIGLTVLLQLTLTGSGGLPFNGWTAALGGALIGLGTVIPGISTSFIMMYLGIYEPFLSAFNRFDMPILLCAGAGFVIVVAALITLVKRLFEKHYGYAYYGALGLLLSSVALIFPGFSQGWWNALNAALFIAMFIATYYLCKLPPAKTETNLPETENGGKDD